MQEFCRIANAKKTTISSNTKIRKLKIGKFVFLEKNSIPQKWQEHLSACTDLTNCYPIGAFFEELGLTRDYNTTVLKDAGKELKVKSTGGREPQLVCLSSEFFNLVNKRKVPFIVNKRRPSDLAETTIEFQKLTIGFY